MRLSSREGSLLLYELRLLTYPSTGISGANTVPRSIISQSEQQHVCIFRTSPKSEYRSALHYLTERTTTHLHFPHKHSAAVRGGPLQTCCCERSIWPVYNLITGHVERAVREILEAAGYESVVEPCHVIGYGLGAVELHLEERSQRCIDSQEHVS